MNPLQMAMQIRHLLRAATWPSGGEVVFGSRNVFVTAGPPSVDLIPETFPMAFVQIGAGTPDEEHPGELIEQTFTIATAVSVMGDRRGEFAIIGGTRTDVTKSAGAGIGEVEERVRNALEEITGADGAKVILGTSSLGASKGTIGNGAHLAWSEIEVTAVCTSELAYAAPQVLAVADGTWTWDGSPCSSRYDFLQYRMGYIDQSSTPVATPGEATEVVYTGAAATTTHTRVQGAIYMVWADYTHRDDSVLDGTSSGLERGAYL